MQSASGSTGRAARERTGDEPARPWRFMCGRVSELLSHVEELTGRPRSADAADSGELHFELSASTAQDVVDDRLLALWLERRGGATVRCRVDDPLAERLGIVRVPGDRAIEELLTSAPSARSGPPSIAAASLLADATSELTMLTGRPQGPVRLHGPADGECVLVAAGSDVDRARRIASLAGTRGAAVAVVAVRCLSPFPTEALAGHARGRAVAVLGGATLVRETLLWACRAAVGGEVPCLDIDALRAWAGLSQLLGRELGAGAELGVAGPSLNVGSAMGHAGDRFLVDALGPLAAARGLVPGRGETAAGAAVLQLGPHEPLSRPELLHALFVPDPSLLRPSMTAALAPEAEVVIVAAAESADEAARQIPPARRRALAEREARVRWVDARALAAAGADADASAYELAGGALLAAASARLDTVLGQAAGLDGLRIEIGDALGPRAAAHVRAGAALLVDVPRAALVNDARPPAPPPRGAPTLPAPGTPDPAARERLERFHLTGVAPPDPGDPLQVMPLQPANLDLRPEVRHHEYPLHLPAAPDQPAVSSLGVLIADALMLAGGSMDLIRGHERLLVREIGLRTATGAAPVPAGDAIDAACEAFTACFDVSQAGRAALVAQVSALRAHLPRDGELLGLGPGLPIRLLVRAVRKERRERRRAFVAELRDLARRLEQLVAVDDRNSEAARAPEAVAASLGGASDDLIDVAALARSLPARRGPTRLSRERRRRIERCIAALRAESVVTDADPILCVHDDTVTLPAGLPVGALTAAAPLERATREFDALVSRQEPVVRALRTARLELAGAYEEARHDALLSQLTWHGFSADELMAVPPVVVVERDRRITRGGLGELSRVLCSGRPIHVLILEEAPELSPETTWQALRGHYPGLGYLAVAHREAFVLQASLRAPEQLAQGLAAAARALRPTVTFVAEPDWAGPAPADVQVQAAHLGRATPCFRYDPDAGGTWAERFDLSGNPDPDRAWGRAELRHVDATGAERARETSFTFAHAAMLHSAYRPHFRVIGPDAWDDAQIEIADWDELGDEARGRALPYAWVVGDDGVLARAVMTRELAFACRDRRRLWRILQELGGLANEHVRRAVERDREELERVAQAARDASDEAHRAELERVRTVAAGEAMERLAQVLLSLDTTPIATPSRAPAPAAPAPGATPATPPVEEEAASPVAEPAPADADDDDAGFGEPYVVTALCTSCNECINVNKALFQYDDNKQARIADPAAGTFAELVTAAEKCPALCIHVGKPRAGDATVTDDLLARAAKFT